MDDTIAGIASRDVETHTNEQGGSQSNIPVRFDLIDGKAMFEMAKVLYEGATKYGVDNWRLIPVEDHLNHLLMHTYAYLAGDKTDEHLSHILCRATFAQGVSLQENSSENISTPDLCELLDMGIENWRKARDDSNSKNRYIAQYYIDAFQSLRISMFGAALDCYYIYKRRC